jgi:hypothetical protein
MDNFVKSPPTILASECPMGTNLKEKDFIQENYPKSPNTFWFWIALFAFISLFLWVGREWFLNEVEEKIENAPFLQVTNREFSLFLWENPEFMRINAKNKVGYLPAFYYEGKVSVDPELADQFVIAPPELLFRYHVWKRLLWNSFIPRSIDMKEFKEFLNDVPEWQPKNWAQAPLQYIQFLESLATSESYDYLYETFPIDSIPHEVWRAFQGWKNYYKEGEKINNEQPTFKKMADFLEKYPAYKRNYWRNIFPKYLNSVRENSEDKIIPKDELAPFLRVAFYNFVHSKR